MECEASQAWESKVVVFKSNRGKTVSHYTATMDVQQTIMGFAYSGVLLSVSPFRLWRAHRFATFRRFHVESWSLQEVCRKTTCIRKDAHASPISRNQFCQYKANIPSILQTPSSSYRQNQI